MLMTKSAGILFFLMIIGHVKSFFTVGMELNALFVIIHNHNNNYNLVVIIHKFIDIDSCVNKNTIVKDTSGIWYKKF